MLEIDRGKKLVQEFNECWSEIFDIEDDYISKISFDRLIKLKQATRNINNLVTYEVTLKLLSYISSILKISVTEQYDIKNNIEKVNSNSNGYDIEYTGTASIIAEVKCNVPINGGKSFGSAQRSALIKDIEALLFGKIKSSIKNTDKYYKFLGMYDCGDNLRSAVEELLRRLPKEAKEKVEIFDGQELDKSKIYVIFVNMQ